MNCKHIIGIEHVTLLGSVGSIKAIVPHAAFWNVDYEKVEFFKFCPMCGERITPWLLNDSRREFQIKMTWEIIMKQRIKK